MKNKSKNNIYQPLDKSIIGAFNKQRIPGPKPFICYAAHSNMFFNARGSVSVCCESWNISEMYPDKSIKEIWFGDEFNKLRDYIEHDDLSLACSFCKTHLLNRNYSFPLIKMFDCFEPVNSQYPKSMIFELDITCNLECVMCDSTLSSAIRKNRGKLPLQKNFYNDEFLYQLEEFIPHLERAMFIGGEPFLIDRYYKIWDLILSMKPDIKIGITTNGTILNKKVKDILERGIFEINFSIDSLDKNTYETIRKHSNFERVMENLYFFHKYCKEKGTLFNLTACPVRYNWMDIADLVRFANELDVPIYFNTVIHPYDVAIWSLETPILEKIHDKISGVHFHGDSRNQKNNLHQYNDFVQQVECWIKKSMNRNEKKELKNFHDNAVERMENFLIKLRMYVLSHESSGSEERDARANRLTVKLKRTVDKLPDEIWPYLFDEKLMDIPMEIVVNTLEYEDSDPITQTATTMLYDNFML